MKTALVIFFILIFLISIGGSAATITAGNLTNQANITPNINLSNQSAASNLTVNITPKTAITTDEGHNSSTTSADQQFLFLMNQYWIPDLYDIKGRIDGASGFGSDVPQMLNLSAEYARIRLTKNINETNGYTVSPAINGLKTQYQTGAMRSIRVIDGIMAQNRSEETFAQNTSTRTAALSLYGTWLEYQVMRCYNLPNITYPEIAAVPPDQFMQVMSSITT